MTIREFVTDLFLSAREYDGERMTVETAREDLDNFAADGWDIPDGVTPEEYADIWNELVEKQNQQKYNEEFEI